MCLSAAKGMAIIMKLRKINTREEDLKKNESTPLTICQDGMCRCRCVCFGGVNVAKAASGWGTAAIVSLGTGLICW